MGYFYQRPILPSSWSGSATKRTSGRSRYKPNNLKTLPPQKPGSIPQWLWLNKTVFLCRKLPSRRMCTAWPSTTSLQETSGTQSRPGYYTTHYNTYVDPPISLVHDTEATFLVNLKDRTQKVASAQVAIAPKKSPLHTWLSHPKSRLCTRGYMIGKRGAKMSYLCIQIFKQNSDI